MLIWMEEQPVALEMNIFSPNSWGGTASISPYTTNKESGFGPAWINSLFEDNAEHGLGMQIGYETVRANLITKVEALKGKNADLDAAIESTWKPRTTPRPTTLLPRP